MDWRKGFRAQYYATFVDPVTWRDLERFEITGGSVKRSTTGLRHSADMTCKNYDQKTEKLIRIWLDSRQAGSSAHTALFTGLVPTPEKDINGYIISESLTCYSVLKYAQDILLPLGWYAPVGIGGAQLVKQLLSTDTPLRVTIIGDSPTLSQYIIAEDGENKLSMAEKILAAINWRLRLKGNGEIEICAPATSVSARFDPISNDCLEPQLKPVNDWFSCPNVFRAIKGDLSAVARDDSVSSPLSTVNRGREVWAEERDCNLNVNESLGQYARRRLQEEQRSYLSVGYNRRFHPDVLVSDLIALNYPAQGISGTFYVTSQSITIGYGARTAEEVLKI